MNNNFIINKTVKVLKQGGVVIFPTDTVWGIGCSINRLKAIKKLYKIKKREKSKPTAILVDSLFQANKLAKINKLAKKLVKNFWPGGLTIIVKAKNTVPKIIQGSNKTIGLRIPSHKMILKILKNLDGGIVAASANFAGKPAPKSKKEIDEKLLGMVDLVIDENGCHGLASTVVDVTQKPLKIIRRGVISSKNLLS